MKDVIAMDCEMVGGGSRGELDLLAKVSLVDKHGLILYDAYVKPKQTVRCYRTPCSGIRKQDLVGAKDFYAVQDDVKRIIRGNILVGHSIIDSDLLCIDINHPQADIRDTAFYPPFVKQNRGKTPSLKSLVYKYLGIQIQTGEHSSVEDARAAMKLYLSVAEEWESKYL